MDAVFGHYSKFMRDSYEDRDTSETIPYIETKGLEKGIIQVVFRFNRMQHKIVIDDFLPCIDNEPIYAKARSGSLWCSFVEKACAKFFSSYNYLYSLSPSDILNNLLPMPTIEY